MLEQLQQIRNELYETNKAKDYILIGYAINKFGLSLIINKN